MEKISYRPVFNDYETFVEFDLKHLPQPRNASARSIDERDLSSLPAPRFVNRQLTIEKF